MSKKRIFITIYTLGIILSLLFHIDFGVKTARNLLDFTIHMMKVLPFAFILIGLFDVWVPKKTIEERLGKEAGLKAHLTAFILAAPLAGGLYVSLPAAAMLYEKGASLDVVLTFLGASTLVRIPMMIFEASFMGIKFTLARLSVSIPLVIISSIIMAKFLERT